MNECALCGANAFEQVSSGDCKTGGSLFVAMCRRCGLVQQQPIPSEDELSRYYADEYRTDYKGTFEPKAKHVLRAGRTAVQRLKFLASAQVPVGTLIDVGAGGGEFVYLANRAGFEARGIEPNLGYANYANRTYDGCVTAGSIKSLTGTYEVITLFHVLEHLPSPRGTFATLFSLVRDNGYVLVEVPWIGATDASPNNIYFKAHIFYFAASTLVASASEFFTPVVVDTADNLKVLFRKNAKPGPLAVPTRASADAIRARLRKKGWFEYVTKGRALSRLAAKFKRAIEEDKVKNTPPKEILDSLAAVLPKPGG